MKNIIINSFLLAILLISCGKKDNSSSGPSSAVKYMTTTSGSVWNYESIDNITPANNSSYTLTSTIRDTTVNSKTYHVYNNSSTKGSDYYNISNSDYYTYQSLPSALGGSKVENLYLKDNLDLNATWTQNFAITASGVPLTVVLTYRIKEKNISKIVNGITYSNVIHVETSVSVSGIPSASLTSDIQSYYAPKAGLIENHTKINLNYLTLVNNTDTEIKLKKTNIP